MNEVDLAIRDLLNYKEYLREKSKELRCIDTHVLKALEEDPELPKASTETKISLWIIGIVIILFSILMHICMIPIRLYSDTRHIFRDIINYIEKGDSGSKQNDDKDN